MCLANGYSPVYSKSLILADTRSHLSWIISQKEKTCMEDDFNNFFEVVSGQLKNPQFERIFREIFERMQFVVLFAK